MTSADFAAWLAHMHETRGWSVAACARALYGDSRNSGNQMARWATVVDPPHYLGLACAAICQGLPAWREIG
jgi:hypothetical protein